MKFFIGILAGLAFAGVVAAQGLPTPEMAISFARDNDSRQWTPAPPECNPSPLRGSPFF